jgi:hypothetical protein
MAAVCIAFAFWGSFALGIADYFWVQIKVNLYSPTIEHAKMFKNGLELLMPFGWVIPYDAYLQLQ